MLNNYYEDKRAANKNHEHCSCHVTQVAKTAPRLAADICARGDRVTVRAWFGESYGAFHRLLPRNHTSSRLMGRATEHLRNIWARASAAC